LRFHGLLLGLVAFQHDDAGEARCHRRERGFERMASRTLQIPGSCNSAAHSAGTRPRKRRRKSLRFRSMGVGRD
jgi:hypothetical protein